jgi:hypothetical protein
MLLLFAVRMARTGIERALGPSFRGLLTASRRPVNLAPVRVGLTWGRGHALKSDSDLSVVDIRQLNPATALRGHLQILKQVPTVRLDKPSKPTGRDSIPTSSNARSAVR